MVGWIEEHQSVLSILISFATLLVWLVYAQLLFSGFRRQRSPRLIINRGRQKDMDALCIISNMSEEAIYVEYIIAELQTSRGTITMDVTDFEQEAEDEGKNLQHSLSTPRRVEDNTRQGPLRSGDYTQIGTFYDIVRRLARQEGIGMRGYCADNGLRFEHLTIRLIALYGPEYRPISATRSFEINSNEHIGTLTPSSWGTKQGTSLFHRHRLCKVLDKMNESNFSVSSTIRKDD